MKKRTPLLSGLLLSQFALSLHADPATHEGNNKPAFQGFHIGANIGYGQGSGHFKDRSIEKDPLGNIVATSNDKYKLGFDGVDGGLGLGYMHRMDDFALGFAFDANWSNASGKRVSTYKDAVGNILSNTDRVRLKNSLQLYAKLGYVIREKVMPFLGFGWDNSEWQHNIQVRDDDTGYYAHQKKHYRLNSGLWKLGFDVLAAKNIIVGFEYTGTMGGSKSYAVPSQTAGGSSTTNFKPQYNKFALTTKFIF